MERIIKVTEAVKQLNLLIDEVHNNGDSIIIEKGGKAWAKIVPIKDIKENKKNLSKIQKQLLSELNDLPILEIDENPTTVLRDLRRKKTEKAKIEYGK